VILDEATEIEDEVPDENEDISSANGQLTEDDE
jgi:hypothetical protein